MFSSFCKDSVASYSRRNYHVALSQSRSTISRLPVLKVALKVVVLKYLSTCSKQAVSVKYKIDSRV